MEEPHRAPFESPKNSLDNTTEHSKGQTRAPQPMPIFNDAQKEQIARKVANINGPLLILFAPPNSGKTALLVRLMKYLSTQGYSVELDKSFRTDEAYSRYASTQFEDLINASYNQIKTPRTADSLLVNVVSADKREHFQVLEAPGEHFYKKNAAKSAIESYMQGILRHSKSKKIFAFLFNQDFRDSSERDSYSRVVQQAILQYINMSEYNVLLIYNKVDQLLDIQDMELQREKAMERFEQNYPVVVKAMASRNQDYKQHFITFSAGSELSNNELGDSADYYPYNLLNEVQERFKKMPQPQSFTLRSEATGTNPASAPNQQAKSDHTSSPNTILTIIGLILGVVLIIVLLFLLIK